jgi:hypothetical protein
MVTLKGGLLVGGYTADVLFLHPRFAEGHNCEELANMAVEFIQLHFPQICSEEEFFELPKELLTKFLSSEHLRVDTEFQVRVIFCPKQIRA